MKGSHYTEEQILRILGEVEAGKAVAASILWPRPPSNAGAAGIKALTRLLCGGARKT